MLQSDVGIETGSETCSIIEVTAAIEHTDF